MYKFTFYNHSRSPLSLRLVQVVRVSAANSRAAWATFEALYPYKRFTAFTLETL